MSVVPTPHQRPDLLTPGQLDELVQSPHIGYVDRKSESTDIFVIGTSHFRCNSAREVTSLIERVRPDGVVLELDPERVLRLTKLSQGFDENGAREGRSRDAEDILYGADFVAAINACQRLDVPLFLGDEYARETKRRLSERLLNWEAYSPEPLVKAFFASISGDGGRRQKVRMNLLKTFAQDPQKLAPIALTSSPPFLLASALALFDNGAMAYDGSVITNTVETIASIIASFLVSSLLFNTVIAERDEVLAASTMYASSVVRSLKDNASIRQRWQFTVSQEKEELAADTNRKPDSLPLFTLKTPLKRAGVRNLNLFEPRWLKMIDQVTKENDALDAKTFGCVRCINKFYSAISVNGVEGRYADVIFERVGTLATIKELKEGKRLVSGDRRISVSIEGGDSFVADASNLSVSEDGYMVATNVTPVDSAGLNDVLSSKKVSTESVRMVVVVGLLHG
eukprot:CAMPEP_0172545480 /NCGR_PEP_ID=MMETSP1067-20121228/15388_1 /TAXON_ID=265564 ORGANISM="Thalassiosira punctigera, Strain Tpunct2005C2" /NCGR_SAMPLE_ID=MMETSP1067 /ASSEMBLY_ACC=CAM_ASM_000444 /LENGTH=453 /DNA_ID=CAMNT_0013332223 /DNA_START=170 /DNA_END=1527 /DNA_ORIENTATION=+